MLLAGGNRGVVCRGCSVETRCVERPMVSAGNKWFYRGRNIHTIMIAADSFCLELYISLSYTLYLGVVQQRSSPIAAEEFFSCWLPQWPIEWLDAL